MRARRPAVLPSLLVMKMVWARARCDGGSRNVPRGSKFVAERLLAVNQNHIMPATAQSPVLETVVEQQRVAAEFFNRVTPAFHAVLVHQHDDILEIRREHVGFVAGHFGIEQQ
jgi:hypothetical protein